MNGRSRINVVLLTVAVVGFLLAMLVVWALLYVLYSLYGFVLQVGALESVPRDELLLTAAQTSAAVFPKHRHALLCSLRLHDWRYRWRRLPRGRGVMLYRTCLDCGSQQKARILSVADSVEWSDVYTA